jgi:hypothetical protein
MKLTLLLGLAGLTSAMGATDPHSTVPLVYFPNYGQEHPAVHYAARSAALSAYFLPSEIVFRLPGSVIRMQFPGATGPARIEPARQLPGTVNFLRGREEEWRIGLPMYDGIVYRRLYPGIDMRYGSADHRLKSEFVVRPGGDPSSIRVRYSGADELHIDPDGSLVMETAGRELREQAPVVYQKRSGTDIRVEGRFALFGGDVGFILGEYDRSLPLVIDPVISYSSLLGGSSSDAAMALAADATGAAYVAGFTASTDFPTANPEQNWSAGGNEVFVAKLNPSGNALSYCTYIGGRGDDRAFGIAVDSTGAAYVAGSTTSANFPLRNALQGRLAGGRNAFVLKLNAAGNGLVYSTYLGGSAADGATGIALDSGLNAYVAGDSTSINFPTTGLQRSSAGSQDAFVAKLSADGSRLVYSTYLGGSFDDHAAGIAVDVSGTAYVTGSTWSTNFPVVSAYQSRLAGGQDAFVARLAANGASLLFSTYLGGSGGAVGSPESGQGIALDAQGNAYVAGVTSSTDFAVKGALQASNSGWQDAFLTKLSAVGTMVYSTYVGGSGSDQANAVAVDASGDAFVAGQTSSVDLAATFGAKNPDPGGYDVFLVEINPAGDTKLMLAYLGGTGADTASAVALDGGGSAYIAGWTLSSNFPVLNAIQTMNGGSYGAFVAKISQASPSTPSVVGATPNSGTGPIQTFTLQYSDGAGAADLNTVDLLFNTSASSANACSITYDRPGNKISLLSDAGTVAGSITPGSGNLQNTQCGLDGARSSAVIAGNTFTLTVAITFQAPFAGAKNIYLRASSATVTTGWQVAGSWIVPGPMPSAVSVSPNAGSGSGQTFSLVYSDPAGYGVIQSAAMLINTSLSPVSGCYVVYSASVNGIYLDNDAGSGWLGPITPGQNTILQNSQCLIKGSGVSISASGNILTVTVPLTFQQSFSGPKNIYMDVNDGADAGWQQRGTWTVIPPPVAIRVNAGGAAYTDPQGQVWSADTGYLQGFGYSTTATIAGTSDQALYRTSHYSTSVTLGYQCSVPNGSYTVTLKFAELYYTSAGQRIFDVAVNGTAVTSRLDIFAAAGGGNRAYDLSYPVTVSNGQVNITLTAVTGFPQVNAIEIVQAAPDFTVGATPLSQTVAAGGSATYAVNIGAVGGFNGVVTLAASGLPAGVQAGLNPATVTGSGSGTMTVTTDSTAVPGIYTLTITGSGGGSHSASVTLVVTPAPGSFTSIRVNAGGGAYTDTQGRVWSADTGYLQGFGYSTAAAIAGTSDQALYRTAHYSTSGTLGYQFSVPNGSYTVTLKFAELYYTSAGQRIFDVAVNGTAVTSRLDIFAAAGGGNRAYDLSYPVTVSNGQVSITLTAVSGFPKVNAIEIVQAAPDFTVEAAPMSQSAAAGGSATYTVTIGSVSGFGGVVMLGTAGLPSGASASFNPATVAGGGTSTMTVTTGLSTPVGTYTVTVTGSSGASHNAKVTLVVTAAPGSFTPIRVNAGGTAYTDGQGRVWSADMGYLQGIGYSTTAAIAGTSDQALYRTAHYSTSGTLEYQFSVPNGSYTVTLKFAELYYTSAGQRIFDVAVNGTMVMSRLDIFAAAGGGNRAYDLSYPVTASNGQVSITLTAVSGFPKVNAIEIR